MEKRTLVALAISFLVLGFYPVILQKIYPDYYKNQKAQSQAVKSSEAIPAESSPALSTLPLKEAGSFQKEQDLNFRNERIELIFNQAGGAIRGISFPKFIDSETKKPLQLISTDSPAAASTYVRLLGTGLTADRMDHYQLAVASGEAAAG